MLGAEFKGITDYIPPSRIQTVLAMLINRPMELISNFL